MRIQFASISLALLLLTSTANALTFKKGEVLGSDGKVYDGASPEMEASLIRRAEEEGELAECQATTSMS